jgi:hypothetical protein
MLSAQRDYKTCLKTLPSSIQPLLQGKHIDYQADGGIGSFIDESGNAIQPELANHLSICLARVEAMVKAMLEVGLLTTDGQSVWSDSLMERMAKRKGISELRATVGRMGGLAKGSKQLLSKGNSKTYQGKERKGKEKKEDHPFSIPEDLEPSRGVITDWIGYKKETGFTYKEKGLKALFSRFREIPVEKRREVIDKAMASGYKGFFYDKKQGEQKNDSWKY